MKTSISLALVLMLITSCANSKAQTWGYATDEFEVAQFSAIKSSIVGNIEINQSNSVKVTAEGSERLLDILEVRIDGNKLILDMDSKLLRKINKDNEKLTVYISTPTLFEIESEGVGNFFIKGTFETPRLTFDSEGVGNIKADNIITEFVRINSEGVGNITIAGETLETEIESEGVGNINAKDLLSLRTIVSSEGIGNVSCYASEYLRATSSGIGNVTYYGNPLEIDLSKEGIGKIKSGD